MDYTASCFADRACTWSACCLCETCGAQRFGGNIGDQHMKDLELEPEKRTSDDE